MINCKKFYDCLGKNGINFFAGVPDSLLKDFCAYVADNAPLKNNIITANEGNAVALAAGHYLAAGKPGMVYMQNSGQGNAVNPLTSLADPEVYSIPLLLLIGWRGKPGEPDEPQHRKQGRITIDMLKTLEIPYEVISASSNIFASIERAIEQLRNRNAPYALVVEKDTFEPYTLQNNSKTLHSLSREEAIHRAIDSLDEEDMVVSTSGMISRELFEYREQLHQGHDKDFITVGSMGHASQIALGIAIANQKKQVYCFDGDGAVIMHMGSLAIIGSQKLKNFKHIVFNNGAHDSVGGQPTVGHAIDIPAIAKACGYLEAWSVEHVEDLEESMQKLKNVQGPALLEINVRKGHRKELGRPTRSTLENKRDFMEHI